MRIVSSCFTIYLFVTTCSAAPVIYSIVYIIFTFLDADFVLPKSSHCHENQLALGTDRHPHFEDTPTTVEML